jgi:exodeoxyribonuclease V gamma subunit
VAGVEGKAAAALGGFWRLLERLRDWPERLAAPRPAADWQRDLGRLTAELFGERDDPDGRLQRIRDAVAELAEQAADRAAAAEPGAGAPMAGGAARRQRRRAPRRALLQRRRHLLRHAAHAQPAVKVICVLGLDDDAFPRRDRPVEFDPMRRGWRPGDPRKGDEDRYLFLETLLGARRRLHLSCVGRDIRSNEPRQPSVLLRELLDHIDRYFVTPDGGSVSEAITRVHPLQPFSPARFTDPEQAAAAPPSFDADWCRVARAVQQVPDCVCRDRRAGRGGCFGPGGAAGLAHRAVAARAGRPCAK